MADPTSVVDQAIPDLVKLVGGAIVGGIGGWIGGKRRERENARARQRKTDLRALMDTKEFLKGVLEMRLSGIPRSTPSFKDESLIGQTSLYESWLRMIVELGETSRLPRDKTALATRIGKLNTDIDSAVERQRVLIADDKAPLRADLDAPEAKRLRSELDLQIGAALAL